MLYKVTFMNRGEKKSIRELNFETDIKANDFAQLYNSINKNGRIIQITKIVSLLDEKKKKEFLLNNLNSSETIDLIVMYYTFDSKLYNCVIPFIPKSFSYNDIKKLMYNIRDFKEIKDIQYRSTVFS